MTDAQIPPGRYIEIITATALSALSAPLATPAGGPPDEHGTLAARGSHDPEPGQAEATA